MARFSMRSPFAFLFARKRSEEQVAVYITREHRRGRDLADILDDPYVKNRCNEQDIARILERPEIVRALGDDVARPAAG
jgi:hypothetical protein